MRALLSLPLTLLLVLGPAACGGGAATTPASPAEPPTTPAEPPAEPPAPAGELVDRAEFTLTMGGQPIGQETAEQRRTADGWEVTTRVELKVADMVLEGTLRTDARWKPLEGRWSGKIGGQEIDIVLRRGADGVLETVTSFDGQQETTRATEDVDFYIADNHMGHMAQLCASTAGNPRAGERNLFPGLVLFYGGAQPLAIPGRTVTVRDVDYGGQISLQVACEGAKLAGVRAGMLDFVATRQGDAEVVAALAVKPREKPAVPAGLVDEDRTVKVPATDGAPAAELSCSFMHPAVVQAKKWPAVVFITGSGAQDRDEDSVGPGGLKMAIFKTMAIRLAQAGIASLRCDDIGTGKSTGDLSLATLKVFTAAVVAQVAALRAEPTVDGKRVGLIGHSEGGVIAPMVALADPRLRAIVLMAGPGRSLDVIVLEQTESSLRAAGADDASVARELGKTRSIFDAWRAGQPLPDTLSLEERAFWERGAPWFKSHLAHDPLAVARKLGKVAVLIAQGGKDQQVRVIDADLLEGAFTAAKNKKLVKKVYPGLNHLFVASETGNFSEYADPKAVIDEGFLTDVVEFLKKNL